MEGYALVVAIWLQFIDPLRLSESPPLMIGKPEHNYETTRVKVCMEHPSNGFLCKELVFDGRRLIAAQPVPADIRTLGFNQKRG